MPDWTRRVSGRYLCADADIRGPLCRLCANKKPAEEKILAGHTCPRPFSYLFYVASKPAGSNDHEIHVVIRSDCLPVKAPKGYLVSASSWRSGRRPRLEGWPPAERVDDDQRHPARLHDRRAR